MKILLIKPPTSKFVFPGDEGYLNEPLELEYVAAGVCDKYDVRILDMRLDKSLEKHLAGYAPDIVGLTSFLTHVYITKNLCKKIKAFNPGILTVIGGNHATLFPGDFNDPNIDVVVRGEGVFTFREIVEHFEKGQDLEDVKGVAFKQGNGLKFTEPRIYPDLDILPLPNRSLTKHYRQNYFEETPEELLKPLANIRTSKGCPFRCKFCSQWKITNGRYLSRAPHSILEEIKTIKEPYIEFADDETFIDIKRMDTLADLIIDAGIKKSFFILARSDTVVKNPGLFEKWKQAGLSRAFMGFESHRAKDLEYFRKKNTLRVNEQAISVLKKIGVKIDVNFIVTPDYDYEDFDNLAEYTRNLDVDFASFMPLTPLPGTDLYDELKDQITTTNLELFDLTHMLLPTKLPLERFYREFVYLIYRANKDRFSKTLAKSNRAQLGHFTKLQRELRNHHLHHQA